jgi:hypothetical protein
MKAYSDDMHWRIIYRWKIYGSSAVDTARLLFVSANFVYAMRHTYANTGGIWKRPRRGKARILSREYLFTHTLVY